jgi:hypothetical protein
MNMKASRNTVRLQRALNAPSAWQDAKDWARRNLSNEAVAEVSLALAAALSLCYVGARIYVGLQNYVMYAY